MIQLDIRNTKYRMQILPAVSVKIQTYSLGDIKGAPVALSHPHSPPVDVTVVFQQGVGEPAIFMIVLSTSSSLTSQPTPISPPPQ